jgi:hypothetical protein
MIACGLMFEWYRPLKDLRLCSDDQEPLKPEASEPVKLTLKPFTVLAHATADQVRD